MIEVPRECTCDKFPHDKEKSQAQPCMIETHNELFCTCDDQQSRR